MWAFESDKKVAYTHISRPFPMYSTLHWYNLYITILIHNIHMSRYWKLSVSFLDIKTFKRVLFSKNLAVIFYQIFLNVWNLLWEHKISDIGPVTILYIVLCLENEKSRIMHTTVHLA
jgi:hypothetical protein